MILICYTLILCRAFNEILRTDHATYGADEDYVIGDTVADEWQQRVDDVVAGSAFRSGLLLFFSFYGSFAARA